MEEQIKDQIKLPTKMLFNQNGNKYGLDMSWEQYKVEFGKMFSSPR